MLYRYPTIDLGDQHLKKVTLASALLFASCVGLLSGCSDEGDSSKKAATPSAPVAAPKDRPMTEKEKADEKARRVFNPTPEERAQDRAEAAASEAERHKDDAVTTMLSGPEAAPALSAYQAVEMGNTVFALYNANAPVPDQAYKVANDYGYVRDETPVEDPELLKLLIAFSHSKDEFVRRDSAKAIEPILQKQVDAVKGNRYVKIELPPVDVASYNFENQTFTLNDNLFVPPVSAEEREKASALLSRGHRMPAERGHITWSDLNEYEVEFSNGDAYQSVPVTDEQLARTLEKLGTTKQWAGTVYGYVDGVKQGRQKKTDPTRTVYVHIQQLDIYEKGKPDQILVSLKK